MIARPRGARHRLVPLGPLVLSLLLAFAALLGVPGAARAQDLSCESGDREVRTLHFVGNRAFSDADLARVVVTTPSSAATRIVFIGTHRCLDPEEFPRDVIRLEAFYRKRGYPTATVDTAVELVGSTGTRRVVNVAFRINEGPALRLDRLTIDGMRGVRDSARILRNVPVARGDVFDRVALEAFRDTVVQRLHNGGYLRADAFFRWSTIDSVTAAIAVAPGPFTRIGRVEVHVDTATHGEKRIPESVVRRTLGVRPGDPYSAADIIEAQRTLYQTDAYRRVEVRVDTAGLPDSLVTLVVSLQQGDLHSAHIAAGWATLDCFRTQGDFTDRYFLPRAQRLDVQARLSRIAIGRPLRFAPDLCPQAKDDPFSDRLNYYYGATLAQPRLFRLARAPALTLFTSRASEYKAFRRETAVGALFSLASRSGTRLPSTLTYQFEVGRTEANAVIFCAVFSACDQPSRDRLARNHPLGAIGYSLVHDGTDDPLLPTSGSLQRITLRHSSLFTGSDVTQRFNKAVGDASWYHRLGDNVVLAHMQLGGLLGGAPQQERLFAGGPTTVRGYPQNELGPAVYLVTRFDTVRVATRAGADTVAFRVPADLTKPQRTIPTGGNTLVVGNLELQLKSPVLPELLQLALFTDAGEVWERNNPSATFRGLRVTPGAGVRVKSLFGVIRVDLGYNAYSLREGQAYYIETTAQGDQALYCVSPGNSLVVSGVGSPGAVPRQDAGLCPATFQPRTPTSFFSRLNPSIWIGNAF